MQLWRTWHYGAMALKHAILFYHDTDFKINEDAYQTITTGSRKNKGNSYTKAAKTAT